MLLFFCDTSIRKMQKGLDFSVEAVIICNFLSSSVGFNPCRCFFRLTPVFRFRFQPLWAVHSTACAASFPLSDPLCLGSLSVPSVSGSDYSASVSSFPFSFRFCLTVASSVLAFRFRFLRFPRSLLPGFPCIFSRFRYSALCLFPFALPCFAPTAVPQVLTFCFRFRPFPFFSAFFRPLLFRF